MSYSNRKQRRNSTFQPDLLEHRELLSTIMLPGHQPADVAPFAKVHKEIIKGSLSGSALVSRTSSVSGTTIFGASGSLTSLGGADLGGSEHYAVSKSRAIKYTNGTASLYAKSTGDKITVTFTGSGKETGTGIIPFKLQGKVTGGTGAYAGAAGTMSASGNFDSTTGAFSIKLTVTLTRV